MHFVGIGGAGMSGIARIMLARGVAVSGSDAKDSRAVTVLRALGATVAVGHQAANIAGADTVVVSTAIRESNVELAEARRTGARVLRRAEALDAVMARPHRRRGRRHPRQDHDHLDAHRRAAGLRPRPVVRDRRRPQRVGHQRAPGQRRRSSSPRPTRATARSCCSTPTSRSSPTSSPTTSTTTATAMPSTRRSTRSSTGSPAAGSSSRASTTRVGARLAARRARRPASTCAPTGSRRAADLQISTTCGSTARAPRSRWSTAACGSAGSSCPCRAPTTC